MSTPASVLDDAFERHTWATVRLLEHLETLDVDDLERISPGTYGTIAATLTHLVDADDRYLQRLEQPDLPPYAESPPQPLDVLRSRVEGNDGRWRGALGRLAEGTLHARIPDDRIAGGLDPAETLLLLQALHHGDDHRAQICTTLGAAALAVPDLDVWTFWDERR